LLWGGFTRHKERHRTNERTNERTKELSRGMENLDVFRYEHTLFKIESLKYISPLSETKPLIFCWPSKLLLLKGGQAPQFKFESKFENESGQAPNSNLEFLILL
jgi:hypothetical protein